MIFIETIKNFVYYSIFYNYLSQQNHLQKLELLLEGINGTSLFFLGSSIVFDLI
jgi:hypothetical protein